MGDVEPQRGEERVFLIPRAEHALSDVAAASGLGTGIPGGPPVYRDVNEERDHGHPSRADVGDEAEDRAFASGVEAAGCVDGEELDLHGVYAPDGLDGDDGKDDDHSHFDDELKHVSDQDAPEAGKGGD